MAKLDRVKREIGRRSLLARALFSYQDAAEGLSAFVNWNMCPWDPDANALDLRKFPKGFHVLLKRFLDKCIEIGSFNPTYEEDAGSLYLEAAIAGQVQIMKVLDDAGLAIDRKTLMESFEYRCKRLKKGIIETEDELQKAKEENDLKKIRKLSRQLKARNDYLQSSDLGRAYLTSFKATAKQEIAQVRAMRSWEKRCEADERRRNKAQEDEIRRRNKAQEDEIRREREARAKTASLQLLNLNYKTATPEQIKALLEMGADINVMAERGKRRSWAESTPVALALEAENYPAFITLVNAGANLAVQMPSDTPQLHDYALAEFVPSRGYSMIEWAFYHCLAPYPYYKKLIENGDRIEEEPPSECTNTKFYNFFAKNFKFFALLGEAKDDVMKKSFHADEYDMDGNAIRPTYKAWGKFLPMHPDAVTCQRYKLPNGTLLSLNTPIDMLEDLKPPKQAENTDDKKKEIIKPKSAEKIRKGSILKTLDLAAKARILDEDETVAALRHEREDILATATAGIKDPKKKNAILRRINVQDLRDKESKARAARLLKEYRQPKK